MITSPPETVSAEWPRFRSTKIVQALRIASIEPKHNVVDGSGWTPSLIHFEHPGYEPLDVDTAWLQKHSPMAGGYVVAYEDGYLSWSPASAFEAGNVPLRMFGLRTSQESKYTINERGRIVNRESGEPIPDEEPVVIFRAKDALADVALQAHEQACAAAGLTIAAVSMARARSAFSAFRAGHGDRVSLPGLREEQAMAPAPTFAPAPSPAPSIPDANPGAENSQANEDSTRASDSGIDAGPANAAATGASE
jgi:hypothetical protein